ncbi:MAG: hypothetical protein V2I35_02935 [Desulfocapsaceae bacterium]|jgi:hypothetical protein|nr:hypothetical protein [Desulfocapsaceae bacterium]
MVGSGYSASIHIPGREEMNHHKDSKAEKQRDKHTAQNKESRGGKAERDAE